MTGKTAAFIHSITFRARSCTPLGRETYLPFQASTQPKKNHFTLVNNSLNCKVDNPGVSGAQKGKATSQQSVNMTYGNTAEVIFNLQRWPLRHMEEGEKIASCLSSDF